MTKPPTSHMPCHLPRSLRPSPSPKAPGCPDGTRAHTSPARLPPARLDHLSDQGGCPGCRAPAAGQLTAPAMAPFSPRQATHGDHPSAVYAADKQKLANLINYVGWVASAFCLAKVKMRGMGWEKGTLPPGKHTSWPIFMITRPGVGTKPLANLIDS